MYHSLSWYSQIRGISMLWQSLGGVLVMWIMLPKKKRYRFRAVAFWLCSGALLFLLEHVNGLVHDLNVYYVYLACIFMVLFCCDADLSTAWMVGGSGYLAQQMYGNLLLTARTQPAIGRLLDFSPWIVAAEIVIYSVGYGLLRYLFRDRFEYESAETARSQQIAFSCLSLLVGVGFYTVNAYVRGWSNMTPVEIGINALYTSACSCAMIILQVNILRRQKSERENRTMQILMYAQSEQFRASVENAELVNEKYHDLKKIISGFRGKLSDKDIDNLYQAIEGYGDRVETGHAMVDLILTEEGSLCRKKNIQLTCLVNGAELSFMDDFELYALLKNILDNAIDAVSQLPKERERYISLKTSGEAGMVLLSCENPCGEVKLVDGIPQTMQDRNYHGFGMKSMERTALKYGGTLQCQVAEGHFTLNISFLPE